MCKVATNNEIKKTVKGPMTRLKWVPKADTSKVLQRARARPVLSRASIFFSSGLSDFTSYFTVEQSSKTI